MRPQHWPTVGFDEAVEVLDSRRRPVKRADRAGRRGEIPYYGASGIIDYVDDYLFDETLVLLGEDGENILSRTLPLAFKISGKSWVNNHAHVLRPRPDFDVDYLVAYLESLDYSYLNTGTAQPKLNKRSCSTIRVSKPSLKEQRAIAEALDDADALVAGLERMIAKKEAVKQGMMQQLLTGRTRLPGFTDPWQTRRLGDIAVLVGGGTPSTKIADYWGGGVPWFTPAEMAAGGSGLLGNSERTITQEGLQNSSAVLLPPGTVLVTSRASIGNCGVNAAPASTNQGFVSLIPHARESTWFLYYWVNQNPGEFQSRAAGSTFLEISARKAALIELLAPSVIEQDGIGRALTEVDNEIRVFRARLDKARAIKEGMMQQLLTGRIHLPAADAT